MFWLQTPIDIQVATIIFNCRRNRDGGHSTLEVNPWIGWFQAFAPERSVTPKNAIHAGNPMASRFISKGTFQKRVFLKVLIATRERQCESRQGKKSGVSLKNVFHQESSIAIIKRQNLPKE